MIDPRGQRHEILARDELRAGMGITKVKNELHACGLRSITDLEEFLTSYIRTANPTKQIFDSNSTGWVQHLVFSPHRKFLASTMTIASLPPTMRDMSAWKLLVGSMTKEHLVSSVVVNSQLELAICAALADLVLKLAVLTNGFGFNIYGITSIGKSTTPYAASLDWGHGSANHGFPKTWLATTNALDFAAQANQHISLALDNQSLTKPQLVTESAYLLAKA